MTNPYHEVVVVPNFSKSPFLRFALSASDDTICGRKVMDRKLF